MSNKLIVRLLIVTVVLFFVSVGLSVYLYAGRTKTGYIDISKVYNSFTLKKELEVQYKNTESVRKNILDSLRLNLEILYKQGLSSTQAKLDFGKLQQQYQLKMEQFKEDNATLSEKYNQQILTQLNQYVQDYGKELRYTYILGANSNGTLMYADENNNITEKVIVFINNRYQGKNK